MTEPGTFTLEREHGGDKVPWHVRGTKGRTKCGLGLKALAVEERGIDDRAIAHAGRRICKNCTVRVRLDELHAERDAQGLDRRSGLPHRETTQPKPTKEDDMPRKTADQLREERTSVNNKISGTKTQLKRLGNKRDEKTRERRAALQTRLDELTAERTRLGEGIAKREYREPVRA